jgi:hypothetical protein
VRSRLFHFEDGNYRRKKKKYTHLIETSEQKTKTMWNIINNVTRKAEKSHHLPHSFKMNNKEVSRVKSAETFNKYFLNMADDLQIEIDMTFHIVHV